VDTVAKSPTLVEIVNRYLGLIRFSHTIFALPFALLATVWAFLVPLPDKSYLTWNWLHVLGILICMVSARSFAMAINRLLDHRIDAANPRTRDRHLPSGQLTRRGVWIFTLLSAIVFGLGCAMFWPNPIPVVAAIPVLLFLGGYSLAKRFTRLAHYWLGVALMLAPICAWLALRGAQVLLQPSDVMPAVWLGGVVLFWVGGFDIIYACQDYDVDRALGLHSIPAKLGVRNALLVARASHAVMWFIAAGMTVAVPELSLGPLFWIALGVIAVLLVWQHSLVSDRSLERINLAFFQLNSVISILFLTVGSLDAWAR
jgi:4-hydroxybenzoate polyprenyltransferase